jgi:hypothetical protein
VKFSYKLTGTGWAEATIADGSAQVVLRTSYLSDALNDLLLAIGSLLEGALHAECSWLEEPGEWRWIFDLASTQVSLHILGFDDGWPRQPEDQGTLVFQTAESVYDLARAIVEGVEAVLAEYGLEEYERRWHEYPFPTQALSLVKERLTA